MSYVDALVATLCCALFALAAFSVQRRLHTVSAKTPRADFRPREEDLVRPSFDATGQAVWATQDELPWHEIVETPRPIAAKRRAG